MIFPTKGGAEQCLAELNACRPRDHLLELASFAIPGMPQNSISDGCSWAAFHVVLYSPNLSQNAAAFWRDTGNGITSRHAEYCHIWLDYLASDSDNASLQTQPPSSTTMATQPSLGMIKSAVTDKKAIESFIAELVTSEKVGQPVVSFHDVFLYANGMSAISAVARALASLSEKSDAVAFG